MAWNSGKPIPQHLNRKTKTRAYEANASTYTRRKPNPRPVKPPPVEEWRGIPGYELRYQVSDLGRVRSLPSKRGGLGRILAQRVEGQTGYLRVNFCWPTQRAMRVHTLVVLAFRGPKPFPKAEIRHLDGSRLNNRLDNLTWGTRSENTLDSVRHGIHANARRTVCPRGHAYDDVKPGKRRCRKCHNARRRILSAVRRLAALAS